jgi:hypothetical protein
MVLQWDSSRRQLVADVQDNHARLVDPYSGKLISALQLAGRPRWCVYSSERDEFLVNIREPVDVALLAPENMLQKDLLPISIAGPHGLDIDDKNGLAYVACDGGAVVVLDVSTGHEEAVVPIGGGPDVAWLNTERQLLYCAIWRLGVIEMIDTRKLVVDGSARYCHVNLSSSNTQLQNILRNDPAAPYSQLGKAFAFKLSRFARAVFHGFSVTRLEKTVEVALNA